MAKIMQYKELVAKMPEGVVEIVELWVKRLWEGRTKDHSGKDITETLVGKVKGALEAMEEMDYITDDERWALYRFYKISNSENTNPAVIVYER